MQLKGKTALISGGGRNSGRAIATTFNVFECAFKDFGLPRAIRTDNGVPFAMAHNRHIPRIGFAYQGRSFGGLEHFPYLQHYTFGSFKEI
jgi:hypothetical protein